MLAALDDYSAPLHRIRYLPLQKIYLLFRYQGSHGSTLRERISESHHLEPSDEHFNDRIPDALVYEKTLQGITGLAGVVEARTIYRGYRHGEIRILTYNAGRGAAELHHHSVHSCRSTAIERSTRKGAAGEADKSHALPKQGRPDRAPAIYFIEHTGGHGGLLHHLFNHLAAERDFFRYFKNDGVAGDEILSASPYKIGCRKIPRHDDSGDTVWLMVDGVHFSLAFEDNDGRKMLFRIVQIPRKVGKRALHVGATLGYRHAHFLRGELREFLFAEREYFHKPPQELYAARNPKLLPGKGRVARGRPPFVHPFSGPFFHPPQ